MHTCCIWFWKVLWNFSVQSMMIFKWEDIMCLDFRKKFLEFLNMILKSEEEILLSGLDQLCGWKTAASTSEIFLTTTTSSISYLSWRRLLKKFENSILCFIINFIINKSYHIIISLISYIYQKPNIFSLILN